MICLLYTASDNGTRLNVLSTKSQSNQSANSSLFDMVALSPIILGGFFPINPDLSLVRTISNVGPLVSSPIR